MSPTKFGTFLVVGGTGIAISLQALAQFGGPMGGAGEGRHKRPTEVTDAARNKDGVTTPADRARVLADRLFELRIHLMLTPEQSTQWERFQSAVQSWGAESSRGRMAAVQQTAPQALQARLSQAQNRYSLMESLAESVQLLYAVLSPEQQRLADQYLPPVIP